jgi:hypothetical protein
MTAAQQRQEAARAPEGDGGMGRAYTLGRTEAETQRLI